MIARFYRPLVMGLLPVALIACMNSPPPSAEPSAAVPLGIDLGGSGPVIASAQPALPAEAQTASPQYVALRLEGRLTGFEGSLPCDFQFFHRSVNHLIRNSVAASDLDRI